MDSYCYNDNIRTKTSQYLFKIFINKHFFEHAIPEYKSLLTDCGKTTFIDLTYESLFDMISKIFISDKQQDWLKYLRRRYIV